MAPTNDPANDRYNPPGNLSEDFEKYKFSELEMDGGQEVLEGVERHENQVEGYRIQDTNFPVHSFYTSDFRTL